MPTIKLISRTKYPTWVQDNFTYYLSLLLSSLFFHDVKVPIYHLFIFIQYSSCCFTSNVHASSLQHPMQHNLAPSLIIYCKFSLSLSNFMYIGYKNIFYSLQRSKNKYRKLFWCHIFTSNFNATDYVHHYYQSSSYQNNSHNKIHYLHGKIKS